MGSFEIGLFVLCGIINIFLTRACVDESSAVGKGKLLVGAVFRVEEKCSLYTCIAQCQMSETCQSVNYKSSSKHCELNKETTAVSAQMVSDDEYNYIDMTMWSESLSGPCSEVSCLSNQRCVVLRGLKTKCVDEFPGCDFPPELSHATVQCNDLSLNSRAVYTCEMAYHVCGGSLTAHCSGDTTWKGLDAVCKEDNITLKEFIDEVKETLPCSVREGTSVSVYGTPSERSSKNKFSINLMKNKDIIVHFDVRFFSNAEVLWSTLLGGSWYGTIHVYEVPFVHGQPFHVNITRTATNYEAVVNGLFHSKYPDNFPDEEALSIEVNFDVINVLVTMDGCPWC